VSHETLLDAVQEQVAPAVTATAPLNVFHPTAAEVAAMVGVQGVPACVTVKVLPAIVAVPVRDVVPALGATL
jgi:hypothetical protein